MEADAAPGNPFVDRKVLSAPSQRVRSSARGFGGTTNHVLSDWSVVEPAFVAMMLPGRVNVLKIHEATEKALQVVRELGADAVVAVGGGSAIGLGKLSRYAPTCLKSSCRPRMPGRR